MTRRQRILRWLAGLVSAPLVLACSVAQLDSWNPPKMAYVDPITGCARYLHAIRGPDAYDVAHGQPYHCEMPREDPDFVDVDQVSE